MRTALGAAQPIAASGSFCGAVHGVMWATIVRGGGLVTLTAIWRVLLPLNVASTTRVLAAVEMTSIVMRVNSLTS